MKGVTTMPCRIKEILILAFVIALLTLYGCTIKIARTEKEVKLPEYIYQSPKDQDYSQASVALFRFKEPNFFSELTKVTPPEPGYIAAYRLHQQLMQKKSFLKRRGYSNPSSAPDAVRAQWKQEFTYCGSSSCAHHVMKKAIPE